MNDEQTNQEELQADEQPQEDQEQTDNLQEALDDNFDFEDVNLQAPGVAEEFEEEVSAMDEIEELKARVARLEEFNHLA